MIELRNIFVYQDVDRHSSELISELRAEFGWEGYGIYCALLEIMRASHETAFKLNYLLIGGLSVKMGLKKDFLTHFISVSLNLGLFKKIDNMFFCEKLIAQAKYYEDKAAEKSQKARESVANRYKKENSYERSTNVVQTNNESNTIEVRNATTTSTSTSTKKKNSENSENFQNLDFKNSPYEEKTIPPPIAVAPPEKITLSEEEIIKNCSITNRKQFEGMVRLFGDDIVKSKEYVDNQLQAYAIQFGGQENFFNNTKTACFSYFMKVCQSNYAKNGLEEKKSVVYYKNTKKIEQSNRYTNANDIESIPESEYGQGF